MGCLYCGGITKAATQYRTPKFCSSACYNVFRRSAPMPAEKTCSLCLTAKPIAEFYLDKGTPGAKCKPCFIAVCSRRRQQRGRDSKRENGTPAARARAIRRSNREIALLHDNYVKNVLRRDGSLAQADIPASLVDLKRDQLRLRRLAKEMQHLLNEKETP